MLIEIKVIQDLFYSFKTLYKLFNVIKVNHTIPNSIENSSTTGVAINENFCEFY